MSPHQAVAVVCVFERGGEPLGHAAHHRQKRPSPDFVVLLNACNTNAADASSLRALKQPMPLCMLPQLHGCQNRSALRIAADVRKTPLHWPNLVTMYKALDKLLQPIAIWQAQLSSEDLEPSQLTATRDCQLLCYPSQSETVLDIW